MAGLADFGYLYGAANLGSSAAFANQLPVDKNAVIGTFPKNYNDNITDLTTLETNKDKLNTGRATRAQGVFNLGQQPIRIGTTTPIVTVAPTPADQMVSPVYAATASTEINPQEPNVPSLGYMYPGIAIGQAPFGPQSLAAGLRNQFVTDQQAAEAAQLRQQAEIQAGLVAAGLATPTSELPSFAEADKRARALGKAVTTSGGRAGERDEFELAPPEPRVLVNGESISQSAYDKLADASQTMAKVLNGATDPTQMPAGAKVIIDVARKASVDPKIALVFGVLESNLNTETGDSPVGAKGIMQVMPGTYEATRLKFLKSSDPALRALAASLPMAARGTINPKTGDPVYTWNTNVTLTADQQAIAGVLYIKDLQQSYPNRPANIIFGMYHTGPGHKSYDQGIVPAIGDFGIDPKTGKQYGMYSSDYNTVGIGLYNQLAQGGFKDAAAGLKTDTAPAAAGTANTSTTASTTISAGVKPPTGAATGAAAPGAVNPNLKPVSTIINIPQAQVEANEKKLVADRQSMVDGYNQTNELRKTRASATEARLRAEFSAKEAQLLRDIEAARVGNNPAVYIQKSDELTELDAKLNSKLADIATGYEDELIAANKGIAAELKVQDTGLWNFAIEKSIRDFNINGGVGQFNHILQNYAGSDTVVQQLATGRYAMLIRKPGTTNEYDPQVGEDGNVKQYTKDEMSDLFHQIVDKTHRANVTAAIAERDKFLATERFKTDLKIQEEVAKIQTTLFKDLKVEEYKAKIESLKNSNDFEIKADTANGTTIIIPKGQRKFMLVYNPNPPDVPTRDGPMPGPVITAVPFPTVGLNTN